MSQGAFPVLSDLWSSFEQSTEVKKHLVHNIQIFRCIRGGLRMAQAHRISFEPREEYWRRPERRLMLAYFAFAWGDRMTPAKVIRRFALQAFQHVDPLHERPAFHLEAPDFEPTSDRLDQIQEILLDRLTTLQVSEAWDQLRKAWKNKLPATAAEHMGGFFRKAIGILKQTSGMESELGIGFQNRLPWFAYLGCPDEATLVKRQAFFFGLANLITTSNAYIQGGSMSTGPLLQNTASDAFLDAFTHWSEGGHPGQPPLMAMGPNDSTPKDCSHYRALVECYGFLNLERIPYYNQAASVYGEWVGLPKRANPLEIVNRVGTEVYRQLGLKANQSLIPALAARFRTLCAEPLDTRVWMEWTRTATAKKEGESSRDLADHELRKELQNHVFLSEDPSELAACMVHLLLDSRAYGCGMEVPPSATAEPAHQQSESGEALPSSLLGPGELALAILKAGKHVLLAGAPGTGKTTLAKFVARSWNKDNQGPLVPSMGGKTPFMTVANSAWSPFHTIGGMVPGADGVPKACPGVFVDPSSVGSDGCWKLRPEAVIVDELNRADMDRCIGELYPLLSGSSSVVHPAGLPGVASIQRTESFRVIATANMDLHDLVFPMSEGMARRFQLLELPGASLEEVGDFLQVSASGVAGRLTAAKAAVKDLFDTAQEEGFVSKNSQTGDDTHRLRIGVGFFGLLRDWVAGSFERPGTVASEEADIEKEAAEVLLLSLTTASMSEPLKKLIRAYRKSLYGA